MVSLECGMGSESADGRGRKIVPEEEAAIVSHARKEVDIQHECCQNGIDCEGQPTPVVDEECGDRYAAGDGEHSQRGDGAAGQEERYQAQEQQP